jgi:hypothetical protein
VRVKRRVFRKENKRVPRTSIIDLTIHNRTGSFCCTAKSLPPKHSREDSLRSKRLNYGEGAGDGFILMFVSVLVSVLVSGAGDSFMIVVLSFFSAGGFNTVVSFCSQPTSNAAQARMRIYFFTMVES